MELIVIVLIMALIVLSAVMLYREFNQVHGRVDSLEKLSSEKSVAIQGLEDRVRKLEKANRKRMPWDAVNKILNAQAAIDRAAEEKRIDLSLIENAREWLIQALAEGTKRDEE